MKNPFFTIIIFSLLLPFMAQADPNPVLACNDLVHISFGNQPYVEVTPDMVLEGNVNLTCPDGTPNFEITIYDEDGDPVVVTNQIGFPIGPNGNPILPGMSTEPAHDLISNAYAGQTLTYVVQHIPSGNMCWGNLTVEDNTAPTISCHDYDLPCNHPNALNQNHPDFPDPYTASNDATVSLLSEQIQETFCDQSDWEGAQIIRIWQAIDSQGNSSTCVQTVGLIAPMLSEIELPDDTTVDCSNTSPSPTITGWLSFGDYIIRSSQHGLCDISFAYDDLVLPSCGGGFKIIREWTYINWCTGSFKTGTQLIKGIDDEAPVIETTTVNISTEGGCTASLSASDLVITDDCSGLMSLQVSYMNNGSLQVVDLTNGATLDNLPTGQITATVTATDACMNQTEEEITIIVADSADPVALCAAGLSVTLDEDGNGSLHISEVDAGSFDACSGITRRIRRRNGCLPTSLWGSTLNFELCDVAETVLVDLQVFDMSLNRATCTVHVPVVNPFEPQELVVQFPANRIFDTCVEEEEAMGEAIVSGGIQVEISKEDTRFDTVEDACYAIERRWTIIDMDIYDPESDNNTDSGIQLDEDLKYQDDGDGYFSYVQTIKVIDQDAPVIEGYTDSPIFCDEDKDGEGTFDLSISASDACTDADDLDYRYALDYDNDGIIEEEGEGASLNGSYFYGDHSIQWLVSDACGNASIHTVGFSVDSCAIPVTICNEHIDLLLVGGMTSLKATDVYSGIDNDNIEVRIRRLNGCLGKSGWKKSIFFMACDLHQAVRVELRVTDANGTQSFCESLVHVGLPSLATDTNIAMSMPVPHLEVQPNTPNPFRSQTTLHFQLARSESVQVKVYDTNGRLLESIQNDYKKGTHQLTLNSQAWNAKGLLFYQINTSSISVTKKMILK